MQPKGLEYM